MIRNFRTYELAKQLYHEVKSIQLRGGLKDQLLRASSSVALNLVEGSAKPTQRDRLRFYHIAFGSLREVQAIVELEEKQLGHLEPLSDHLAACLYRLTRAQEHP